MSLLLKALQNAAKNREEAAPADPSSPAAENKAGAATELSLEPVETNARAASTRPASASGDEVAERSTRSSQQHAQNVFRAGAAARAPAVRSPGLMDWLARRPLVAFSTAAGLFAIGYGTYLYLQITNPGIFVARLSVPPAPPASPAPTGAATPPVMSPAPPAAPPPQPQVGGTLGPAPPQPPEATTSLAESSPTPASAPVRPAAAPVAAPPTAATRPPASVAAVPSPPPAATSAPILGSRQQSASPPPAQKTAVTEVPSAPLPGSMVAGAPGKEALPKPRTAPRLATAPAARAPAEPTTSASQVAAVDAGLLSAYQALETGRLDDAERMYRQALASDPRSIDAMLGLASTLTQQNKADAATQLYMRILEQDPHNALAQAGLLSIGGRADPAAAETRLKQLIAREPSAYLYFSLGNLYAEQRQWAAAQGAYFQAFNLAPDNPDYAFNLAVGLEHLSQPKLALDYYRKAVALAQARGNAQFALAPVQTRIRSIEAVLSERP